MSTPIKRILLTGDDGYNSPGTRLLIHALRGKYELKIAGTNTQQSGVGGKVSLKDGFDWRQTEVEGIEALCVEGTPADAVEVAVAFFRDPFDLTISGVNWGTNIGSGIFGSGTVNAALRAASIGLSPKVMAISWDLPPSFYVMEHEPDHDLEPYLVYPGELLPKIIDLSIEHDFWNANLLNINFPQHPATEIILTETVKNHKEIYDYTQYHAEGASGHFMYGGTRVYNPTLEDTFDAKALTNGLITITPCKCDIFDDRNGKDIIGRKFQLK